MAKTKITYIGVDGGLKGSLCVLQEGKIKEIVKMPIMDGGNGRNEYDSQALVNFLAKYPDAIVVLEKAQYTPKLGGIASFTFGKSYGIMIGVLSALKMRYHIVHSKTWQKYIFADQSAADTKAASKIVAQRLFPNETFLPTARSKNVSDGMTDACLIAYYGYKHL